MVERQAMHEGGGLLKDFWEIPAIGTRYGAFNQPPVADASQAAEVLQNDLVDQENFVERDPIMASRYLSASRLRARCMDSLVPRITRSDVALTPGGCDRAGEPGLAFGHV